MAFVDLGQYPSRRAISLAGAALVHVALGYAFINGLAYQVIKEDLTVLIGYNVKKPEPPKPIPQKDPVKKQTKLTVAEDPLVKRSEEHTSELQSLRHLVCRLLLEKEN